MVLVGVVVVVGHEPFVDAEDAAGFEDAVDLGVDAFEGGGMDGCFDGVDGVEAVFWEGHLLWSVREASMGERDMEGGKLTMKSPLTKSNCLDKCSFAAYRVARSIW